MNETARQKFKYIENEKSIQDEIKRICYHFWRAIIEANNEKKIWKVGVRL